MDHAISITNYIDASIANITNGYIRERNLPAKVWNQPWSVISGGESERILSLAIALSLHPQLLLLDEPTSSNDAVTTSKIEHILLESNCTVVIVSHSKQQLKRLCTNIIEFLELLVARCIKGDWHIS